MLVKGATGDQALPEPMLTQCGVIRPQIVTVDEIYLIMLIDECKSNNNLIQFQH